MPELPLSSYICNTPQGNHIPLQLNIDSNTTHVHQSLIDSGAMGLFIDINYMQSKPEDLVPTESYPSLQCGQNPQ